MKLFEPIYTKILQWAKHPHAEQYLAGVSFAESSFFPIPVDVMLAPMVLANRAKAWRLAAITTVMSVLGGMAGYMIGRFLFDSYGEQFLLFFDAHETFELIKHNYNQYGVLIILLAGFTPVPYKIFTIASGVMSIAFLPFVLLSLVGRGARFFLVAGLVRLGGDRLEETLLQKVEWLGWGTLLVVGAGGLVYYLTHLA
ncbi:YqaA family protein [Arenicella xantha]|uniref:Membrane protein YqaA with SNARE-associated domain n=1 Tax=Arenicella xantha TaxID=644221 RepID=A0A395JP78_9GAMM|nr:YqaA family protein [Arenicella xantha]RBP51368.1 membrane protein YqaA with SNARE-associated domain [Arenicella xantha]